MNLCPEAIAFSFLMMASRRIANTTRHGIIRMTKIKCKLSRDLSRAISAYRAGKLVEAERICQHLINSKRDLFNALHLLGVARSRLGKMGQIIGARSGRRMPAPKPNNQPIDLLALRDSLVCDTASFE
jgi:hypothetical protein